MSSKEEEDQKKPPYQSHKPQQQQRSIEEAAAATTAATEEEFPHLQPSLPSNPQHREDHIRKSHLKPPPVASIAVTAPTASAESISYYQHEPNSFTNTNAMMMNQLQLPYENEAVSSTFGSSHFGPSSSSSYKTSSMSLGVGLQQQQQQQAAFDDVLSSSQAQTDQPQQLEGVSSTDVLCGRDRISHAHVGNKQFRKLIESQRERYQSAPSREVKTQITIQVIATIHERGGRFLKLEDGTTTAGGSESGKWVEVSDQYAREKCSHALRSAKDPHRPKVKKRRVMKEYVPTPAEETLFKDTLADQQNIFTQMINKYQQHVQPSEGVQQEVATAAAAASAGPSNSKDVDNDGDDDNDEDPFDFEFYN